MKNILRLIIHYIFCFLAMAFADIRRVHECYENENGSNGPVTIIRQIPIRSHYRLVPSKWVNYPDLMDRFTLKRSQLVKIFYTVTFTGLESDFKFQTGLWIDNVMNRNFNDYGVARWTVTRTAQTEVYLEKGQHTFVVKYYTPVDIPHLQIPNGVDHRYGKLTISYLDY